MSPRLSGCSRRLGGRVSGAHRTRTFACGQATRVQGSPQSGNSPECVAVLPGRTRCSCAALQQLGPRVQWVQTSVTEDKMTCVHIAPNAELVREHARRGGFPADRVLEVATIIDPSAAESSALAPGADM